MTHPSSEFLDLQAALAGEYSLERELELPDGVSGYEFVDGALYRLHP